MAMCSGTVWGEKNVIAKQKMVLHLVNARLHPSEQFRNYSEYSNWITRIINRLRG